MAETVVGYKLFWEKPSEEILQAPLGKTGSCSP